jgi:hypothetical protein
MLDQTETKTGLDAIQIAALRRADTVCFFHRAQPDATGEISYIDAGKRVQPSPLEPFAPDSRHVIVPCEFRLREYTRGDDKIPFDSKAWSGFEMIHSAQFSEEWKTIASLLRVGDKLTLHWQRGAWTTEAMAEASPKFYGDSLSLIVDRPKASLSFLVTLHVGENNSARMIRKGA